MLLAFFPPWVVPYCSVFAAAVTGLKNPPETGKEGIDSRRFTEKQGYIRCKSFASPGFTPATPSPALRLKGLWIFTYSIMPVHF
jgi:hypothetical protein